MKPERRVSQFFFVFKLCRDDFPSHRGVGKKKKKTKRKLKGN